MSMDRYWLLTNTAYGNRLPGDSRGFVGNVIDHRPFDDPEDTRVIHNIPGIPFDAEVPELERASRSRMKGDPIRLHREHAIESLAQFQETARQRRWHLEAVAVMFDHFHLVVGVLGDPAPGKILGDFKSWATRRLTRLFGEPRSQTWWTERGSKRKLPDDASVIAGRRYVLYEQIAPLLTWSEKTGVVFGIPSVE